MDGAIQPLPRCPELLSLDPRTLADVFADIRRVGAAVGRAAAAEALVGRLEERLAAVRAAAAGRPAAARPGARMARPALRRRPLGAGDDRARRRRRRGRLPRRSARARLTWDEVRAADPDVIVAMPCGFDEAGARAQIAAMGGRPEWEELRAVRDGRVFPVDANGCFSRPGPRLVDGIETLAALLRSG